MTTPTDPTKATPTLASVLKLSEYTTSNISKRLIGEWRAAAVRRSLASENGFLGHPRMTPYNPFSIPG